MTESVDRPGPGATPFRVTIYGLGPPRTFPMYADAAYDNAVRAAPVARGSARGS